MMGITYSWSRGTVRKVPEFIGSACCFGDSGPIKHSFGTQSHVSTEQQHLDDTHAHAYREGFVSISLFTCHNFLHY